jgi:hypothetical protein
MAANNKTLGRFDLVGIPAAPRGVPQIEVTFDIDANGIVHVSAKDLATQKEQSIRITASSGLSEEEIKNLVREGELHAEEDRKKRDLVEARNQADSMIYSTERTIREMGDKLDAKTRQDIEGQIEKLRKVMEEGDRDAIQREIEQLTQISHKVAEEAYKRAAEQQAATGGAAGGQESAGAGSKANDSVPICGRSGYSRVSRLVRVRGAGWYGVEVANHVRVSWRHDWQRQKGVHVGHVDFHVPSFCFSGISEATGLIPASHRGLRRGCVLVMVLHCSSGLFPTGCQ